MAEVRAQSPLETFAAAFAEVAEDSGGALAIQELPFVTQLTIRVTRGSEADARVAELLGVALPLAPNSVVSHAGRDILWMGPDEWLIVAEAPALGDLERQLVAALDGLWGSVVNVSAQRTIVVLEGPAAREVLARGCAIDLHPASFGPGRCAQTLLAQAQVILQPESDQRLRVFVRASFARYLGDWLLDASVEERGAAAVPEPVLLART